VYCATKHAVDALTRTLRIELVDTGIKVTSIDPGLVDTEFSVVRLGDKAKADAVYEGLGSEALSAADVAESVVFAATRRANVQVAQVCFVLF
jgi:3-hydroxy acid dehydrogenase/malonic semialdehyde reductase